MADMADMADMVDMVDMADTIPKKLYDALRKDDSALQSSTQKLTQRLKQRKPDTWMGRLLFPLVGKKFFHSQKINPTLEYVYKQYFNKSELTKQDKADIMKIQKMYGALRLFHGTAELDAKQYKIRADKKTFYRRQEYHDKFFVCYTWNIDTSLRITISDGKNAVSFIFAVPADQVIKTTIPGKDDRQIHNLPPLNQLHTIDFFDSIKLDKILTLQLLNQKQKLQSFHSCISHLYKLFEDPNNFKNNSANPTWRIRTQTNPT